MSQQLPIVVIGAGAWGTALAIQMARNEHPVRLWDRDAAHCESLKKTRQNQHYLPGIVFPKSLEIYSDLSQALKGVTDVLIVVPSYAFRDVLNHIKAISKNASLRICWGSKGIDKTHNQLLHEVVAEVFSAKTPAALIAGPSFAKEVAAGLPTAITLAHSNEDFAEAMINRLHGPTFRVYGSTDLIGSQICSAVKNVIAIAVGVSDGLKMGANARSALITRGLAEISRLGIKLGGKRETFMGLAGLGDLVLTATDDQSRNRRFGLALATRSDLDRVREEIGVVEGADNAIQVWKMAQNLKIEMPITEQVYKLVTQKITPKEAVNALLSRELKSAEF